MLNFIATFFQSLAEFFSNIWNFITDLINDIITFFKILKPTIDFTSSLIFSLPPIFLAFGLAIIIVLLIYIIINRTAGGD